MNDADNPYRDPFLADVDATSHAVTQDVVGICIVLAVFFFVTLAAFMTFTYRTPQTTPRTRSAARRRLVFIGVFGILTGLSASFPFALVAGANGMVSAVTWGLCGTAVIGLVAIGGAAALAHQTAQGTRRRESEDGSDDDDHARCRHGINPATGYPMINSSVDAGGYTYGTGRDSLDHEDRHWDRE